MKKMIKNKGILFSALASVMMMTACNSEEDVFSGENNEPTGKVMYAIGGYDGGNNPQSRMSYEDNFETNHMKLAWSEGDAFSAFVYGGTENFVFKIQAPTSGSYTASETFKCDNFVNPFNETEIDAIYPSVLMSNANTQQIALELDEQEQKGSESTDHLKKYDYMVAHATYDISNPNNLNFSFKNSEGGNSGRLASIYRIKMALPSTVESVSKIEISCKDANNESSLVTNVKVNIHNAEFSEKEMGKVTLNVTEGKVENGEFVAYVMLFPSSVKERTITVTAKEGGVDKIFTDTKTYDTEAKYKRGEFKYINLNFAPKNFYPEYTQADFKTWSKETCKDAPSYDEMRKYLGAGVYWDNGGKGDHQQTYSVVDRNGIKNTYHTGLWVMKMSYINKLESPVEPLTYATPMMGRPKDIDKYFFLPAAGGKNSNNSYVAGAKGAYWSKDKNSLPTTGATQPIGLLFSSGSAMVFYAQWDTCCLPMVRK